MKYVIFIYNPIAGERLILERIDAIIHAYQRAGFIVMPIRISRDIGFQPLMELHQKLGSAIDHITLAGGDGSMNRLVNYMMQHRIDIPIAILPAGTANDFATTIGMPRNFLVGVKTILNGKVRRMDVGKTEDKYFVNIFSCGLFTDISQKTPTMLKNTFGRVAYYFGTIGELPNFRQLNISLSSSELAYTGKCLLFMVFNGRTAGNLPLARLACTSDGLLDVFVIKGTNIANTIRTLSLFLLQRKGASYPDDVVYFQTNKLRVNIDPQVPTDIDGEPGGKFPMVIECVPRAIRVIVPSGNASDEEEDSVDDDDE